jgi:hypothetical protein
MSRMTTYVIRNLSGTYLVGVVRSVGTVSDPRVTPDH